MTKQELYLKTIFCCMACDGDIADEEIDLIRKVIKETSLFDKIDVTNVLNTYIADINKNGKLFLNRYLNDLAETDLTSKEELTIVGLSIKMIESDNIIKYSEVQFFKKIRVRLSLSDEQILEKFPEKEDFLLPDINVYEEPEWEDTQFRIISLNLDEAKE